MDSEHNLLKQLEDTLWEFELWKCMSVTMKCRKSDSVQRVGRAAGGMGPGGSARGKLEGGGRAGGVGVGGRTLAHLPVTLVSHSVLRLGVLLETMRGGAKIEILAPCRIVSKRGRTPSRGITAK